MMTRRRSCALGQWVTAAASSGEPSLQSFASATRADEGAVTAGPTLPWSSSSVKGHVNRIKMLKRQMYGRANPERLRCLLLAD